MTKKMKPLYMWAGGKGRMLPRYQDRPGIPTQGYDTYVEPFFGGGAMMTWLAANAPGIQRFVLNDINIEIVNLYRMIRDDVQGFMRHCDDLVTPYLAMDHAARKKFYYTVRDSYIRDWPQWSQVQDSATLYFLMKTAFNGIWQTTQASQGRFCTPAGLLNHRGQVYDADNVRAWHDFLQRVDICSGNWDQCLSVSGRAFYFFDPPYRDSFTQYAQTFQDQDHDRVIEFCRQAHDQGHRVFYSGRDAGDDFYVSRQGRLGLETYPIKYTAGRRATAQVEDDQGQTQTQRTAKAATEILLYGV
jgi:DNA adenine methylase